MADSETKNEAKLQPVPDAATPGSPPKKKRGRPPKNKAGPAKGAKAAATDEEGDERKRKRRPYPAMPFEEALALGAAIHKFASGEKVRRLTLCKSMQRTPTSSATQNLITNSSKYGLTQGGHSSDVLSLTEMGALATNPSAPKRQQLEARFKLAIEGIPVFNHLYATYKSKKLPSHDVMKDVVTEHDVTVENPQEAIDTFVVNIKFLGLLQSIGGSETLVSIEEVLESTPDDGGHGVPAITEGPKALGGSMPPPARRWDNICFYVTAIGEDGSPKRRHSDTFLNALIIPALKEFNLEVVRADKMGHPGMITSQILEHLMRARLVVVDLSWHNPNVFYEMAIRHACKLPIVQISQKCDALPFDVSQVRTVVIDTDDKYDLVSKLETYKSEIATQVRAALQDDEAGNSNPLSVFFPGFAVTIPKAKA